MIEDDASYRELKSSFESYLAKYGDRAMEDLKLEIPGYREQPEKLVGLVRRYVRTGLSIQEMEARESGIRQSAERLMRDHLKNPFKRLAYSFVLRQARLAIANRENMRFARSRLYGIVRQIFLKMGRLFEEKGLLRSSDDIFYLTVDEVFGVGNATAVTRDLKALVRIRRSEYRSFGRRSLKERIETTGIPHLSETRSFDSTAAGGSILSGIGCSSGTAEGTARVGFDPGEVVPDGRYILVARSTDPGWVFLMASSAGIVAEKGSVLSHTAIIGRELGIPTVVGVRDATRLIRDGSPIRIDGGKGEVACL